MPQTEEEKRRAHVVAELKYERNNVKQIKFVLNKNTDSDIIEKLGSVGNIRQYIIGLIKSDMAKKE